MVLSNINYIDRELIKMNDIIKIGRRHVDKETFVKAVQNSKSVIEVCKAIGFNETVCTTHKAIRERIEAMQIDTAHFTLALNREHTDKFKAMIERRITSFKLCENNQKYYEAFEKIIAPASWPTYKATIGNFLESLGDIDFAKTMNTNKIDNFTQGRASAESHIKSLMIYIVSNDINGAKAKVYKDMLLWCVSNRAKKTT
jgi:hypothetical protein